MRRGRRHRHTTMKHLIATALTFLMALPTLSARQVMTFLSGEELEVEIITLGSNEISYKKASNPDGPTYTTSRDKIFYIIHDDGTKEIITPLGQTQAAASTSSSNSQTTLSAGITAAVTTHEKNYFPRISFYPRAAVGFHATPSGYKDEFDIDWGGLSWAFDLNVLFPSGNTSAWSAGIGLSGLGGDMNMLYLIGDDHHKDKMGNFSTMYLTIPVEFWYRCSDWFMFGIGTRPEILLSQKMEGEKIEDAFQVFRDSFLLDGIFSVGNFDIGAQLLLNLSNALKGDGLDWSPTIGMNVTAGYRF